MLGGQWHACWSWGAPDTSGWLTDKAVEAGHDVRVYDLLLYEERYLKNVRLLVAGDMFGLRAAAVHTLDWLTP